jgi:hypothetical protein
VCCAPLAKLLKNHGSEGVWTSPFRVELFAHKKFGRESRKSNYFNAFSADFWADKKLFSTSNYARFPQISLAQRFFSFFFRV